MTDIRKFIAGYRRFQQHYFGTDRELYGRLCQGQHPDALVIACSDAQVDPAILMGCGPGDLFVVRNVANLVPPYQTGGGLHGVSAALEFAVCVLEVPQVIVLGHSRCDGIHALMHDPRRESRGEFIGQWVNIAARARERVWAEFPAATQEEQSRACAQASIGVSLENLQTFPWISERVRQGRLQLHGWYFDVESADMLACAQAQGKFVPLA